MRGRFTSGFAAALVCALAIAPSTAGATDWTALRTLNIAHQGGEDEAPSNTMYAYERSLLFGADMLEVDIHTTADGELVVLHDATVNRTTNGTGRVYDMTLAEIQALDAGHNMVPGEGTEAGRPEADYPFRGIRTGERKPPPGFAAEDFRIPTLDEVIRAYPDVPINIEIKGASDADSQSYFRNADALAAYLNGLGRAEGIMVASFHDEALLRFHQQAPQIDLAPGIAGVAGYKLSGTRPPEGTRAFQVPIEFNGISVTDQEFVTRAHRDGYGVHVWTINDPAEMNMLLDWGVDGIMTAEPIRLEEVLCERDVARPVRPASAPDGHCEPHASIACDVAPKRARLSGGRLRVTLRRADVFSGRCEGQVRVKGAGRRAKARFEFGDTPPGEGGPAKRVAGVKLPGPLRAAIEEADEAKVRATPYLAFPAKRVLPRGGAAPGAYPPTARSAAGRRVVSRPDFSERTT
jgi:glycerophosphoryl diester phosphodiesterase